MRIWVLLLLSFLLTACESNPPAPVIERAPPASKPKPPESKPTASKMPVAKEWRPDYHVVKKGDTLFGIGLEYGIDYKEIAVANNIAPPYPIKIGQKLDLSSFKSKTTTVAETTKTEDGVVITPIKTEPSVTETNTTPTEPSVISPVLSEPKAIREPYSNEAFNRTPAKPTVVTKPADKPTESKPVEAKSGDDESLVWTWPTQGKIVSNFGSGGNKGIDISGAKGQSVNAASNGKVIYSGADLRGYGKLVIVKHNKTYLSVYAHNNKILVKEGQPVTSGQKIAEMGDTDSNSVKLHFEIRRLGKSVDPLPYLNQN